MVEQLNSGKVEQCGEHWNSDCGTVWWNSGIVTEEQCWWNSVVEQ